MSNVIKVINAKSASKLYDALKLARYEIMVFANYCEENEMPNEATSYNNLADYILSVLQEAKGE